MISIMIRIVMISLMISIIGGCSVISRTTPRQHCTNTAPTPTQTTPKRFNTTPNHTNTSRIHTSTTPLSYLHPTTSNRMETTPDHENTVHTHTKITLETHQCHAKLHQTAQ
jgi:hypothetical protein